MELKRIQLYISTVEMGQIIKTTNAFVGFKVLTAVVMNSTIFWDITPCSSLSLNRRFGGTYCLHLQVQ
jgi:hypothetical protein